MANCKNGGAQMEAGSSTEAHPKPEQDDKSDQAAPDEAMGEQHEDWMEGLVAGAPATPKLPTPRRLEERFEDAMGDKDNESSKREVGLSEALKGAYEARVQTPGRPPATKRRTEDEQQGSNA
jgi:hypothetical protein